MFVTDPIRRDAAYANLAATNRIGRVPIAKKAISRKTGARGLRAILEESMLEIMYDVPSMENVKEVVVNEDVISGRAQPMVVLEDEAVSA